MEKTIASAYLKVNLAFKMTILTLLYNKPVGRLGFNIKKGTFTIRKNSYSTLSFPRVLGSIYLATGTN